MNPRIQVEHTVTEEATTPVGGTVQRLAIAAQQQVEGGDLLNVVG